MDYWPTILAALTTIAVNVLLIIDWINKHKGPDEPAKADEPEKVDEPNE